MRHGRGGRTTDRLPKAIDSVFLSPVTDRARNSPQSYDWKTNPGTNKPESKREGGKEKGKKRHARARHIQKPQSLSVSLFFDVATCFGKASKMEKCLRFLGFFFFFCFFFQSFLVGKVILMPNRLSIAPCCPGPPCARGCGVTCAWGCCGGTSSTPFTAHHAFTLVQPGLIGFI